jgi:hypothetical protein
MTDISPHGTTYSTPTSAHRIARDGRAGSGSKARGE